MQWSFFNLILLWQSTSAFIQNYCVEVEFYLELPIQNIYCVCVLTTVATLSLYYLNLITKTKTLNNLKP